MGYGNTKPTYEELCADKDSWTPTQFDWVRIYQKVGKRNMTMALENAPDTVPGSLGATCLFGGCVGSNWEQEVAEYAALNGIPADQINPGPGSKPAVIPTPVSTPTDFISKPAVQPTAPGAQNTVAPVVPSSASGLMASLALLLVAAAL